MGTWLSHPEANEQGSRSLNGYTCHVKKIKSVGEHQHSFEITVSIDNVNEENQDQTFQQQYIQAFFASRTKEGEKERVEIVLIPDHTFTYTTPFNVEAVIEVGNCLFPISLHVDSIVFHEPFFLK